jgi:radical SAM protein with 4Fe4S-binding SPASM domain
VVVFTGGDPMKRGDIFEIVAHATEIGLTTAMTLSATPLVTEDAICSIAHAGIGRVEIDIDGADAATHDSVRGVESTFKRAFEILEHAKSIGLPVQITTTITRRNADQVDAIAEMLAPLEIELWSVAFLVPTGRARAGPRLEPERYEAVFERLWRHAQHQPYAIKTADAHHYRRFVMQRAGNPQRQPGATGRGRIQRAPLGLNDGKGVLFVSHTGTVFPSGFMPIRCGKFSQQSVVTIYQSSAIFRALRSPNLLHGKCGECEFRFICGGSRARAYALTRDPLAAEPDCVYMPAAWRLESWRQQYAKGSSC